MTRERRRRLTIYLPADAPGETVEDKARWIIAAGFAEVRTGDPEPSPLDRSKAEAFAVIKSRQTESVAGYPELAVVIEAGQSAMEKYRRLLELLE